MIGIKEGIMEFIVDESIKALGIQEIVIGIAKNVEANAKLSDEFLEKQAKAERSALDCDVEKLADNHVIEGYNALLKKVGRSPKKNPPTAIALIKNIQHRGSIPHINSIIDIYNVESINSLLAIGGHDLDKIDDYIKFTVSKKEDSFLPILSTPKHVSETDYVYCDSKGIAAWLDVRDGENYKFDANTKNAIFIIQGNENTSVEMRLEALARIESDLKSCMPNLEFKTLVVNS